MAQVILLAKLNRDTDVEDKCMHSEGEKRCGVSWRLELTYTLVCIK